jgi:hypothetical protein
MKRVLLWGFTGATSALAMLGLSSVAHAAEPGNDGPQLPGLQAPGPVVPPGSSVPRVTGPQLPGLQAPGPVAPPAQPNKPGNGQGSGHPNNGRGSEHPNKGRGSEHSHHGKGA